jgi:hypothetical protein
MAHLITKNKKAGRKASKEICNYLGFLYRDPIGEEDGRSEMLRMTLENKRVARTALSRVFEQAEANTPSGFTAIVTIRPHWSRVEDAFVVMRARDFMNLIEKKEEE